ncbi:sterol desaturase family protein [Flavobacterium caeni]|uniref:Beta-carotene 3-hydroxylase n=1 Tax=Flavobacterium caeni TaxID=490189 RepID=A0A1G5HRN2_9FLAO|nr:sterol desaturase family protein [Flavobacterium caeni]SCY66456.1 beta-carotene 3-hydroxylase [Flavobacterium caeni]
MNYPLWLHIAVGIVTFLAMESVAWLSHKYIMHGVLWIWHKDHHRKHGDSWFERNDLFFLAYAIVCISFFLAWRYSNLKLGLAIGVGIFCYGLTYFVVHDIFIHQRFKLLRNINNKYARAVRRAHKVHHKHLDKEHGECFGMLFVPFKYFTEKTKKHD